MHYDKIEDTVNAFVNLDCRLAGDPDGPLAGLTFAAKDIFDVAGFVTGAGNPDWAQTHSPAMKHSWAIETLTNAGATLNGKTITDELTRGILGNSPHFGTPTNPSATDRVPGGSSSGSAAAVAASLVDFSLGSDTGGSVRVPASFCGLYGIRPTHGSLSLEGVFPQADSFDTMGWFARDADTFARVGRVLFSSAVTTSSPSKVVIAQDAFDLASDGVIEALQPALDTLVSLLDSVTTERLSLTSLEHWRENQVTLQGNEAWNTMGEWISATNPRVGFEVAIRFLQGMSVTRDEVTNAENVRQSATDRVNSLLANNAVICLPTSPVPAPLRNRSVIEAQDVRTTIVRLTCIAGLTGCPQISLPLGEYDGAPVGLSLIGSRGSDMMLIDFAQQIASLMGKN